MGLRLQKKPDGYEDCKTLREIAEQSGLSITTINGRISVWKVKPVLFVTEKGIVYRLFAKEDAERLCAPLKTRNMPKDAAAKKKQEQKPTQEKQAQPKPPANGLLKKALLCANKPPAPRPPKLYHLSICKDGYYYVKHIGTYNDMLVWKDYYAVLGIDSFIKENVGNVRFVFN